MNTISTLPAFDKKLGRYTLGLGILLLLLGMTGFLLPGIMSLTTDVLLGYLLLTAGIFWGLHSIHDNPKRVLNWLKPAILVGSGLLMLFYPKTSIEALALVLAVYLLLDSAGSFTLAFNNRLTSGWWWMLFNGVVSLLLAAMILFNWPAISAWIVGIYVGISLTFDGAALLAIYFAARKQSGENHADNHPEGVSPA
jgi:uncharacterized membrane protein HdeD (DUF308 family)